jgi:uncharacterized protein DUF349
MEINKNENESEKPQKADSVSEETTPVTPVSDNISSSDDADNKNIPEEENEVEAKTADQPSEEPIVEKTEEVVETKVEKEKQVEPESEIAKTEKPVEDSNVEAIETTESKVSESEKPVGEKAEIEEKPKEKIEEKLVEPIKKNIDYAKLNKQELLSELEKLVQVDLDKDIKDNFEEIKTQFYKKHKQEIAEKKKQYVEKGGNPDEFVLEEDEAEKNFKAYSSIYRTKKTEYNRQLEDDKKLNLQVKYDIINEIKDLINRKESINKTFQDFRELQKRWREVGLVPQSEVKNLWETYHHNVEQFYDYIKINKELRDLDLKKNLENKIELCERAESLLLETNTPKAFAELQTLHDKWREIGPVPRDKKEELWERFKEATAKINKKHQEYYQYLKDEQIQNLKQKEALCEKVEDINKLTLKRHKKWEEKSKEIIEMQKMWKSIGFAPRKDNHKVYKRFKDACDEFFDKKRAFFESLKTEQDNNLQIKLDLCVQAEALKNGKK